MAIPLDPKEIVTVQEIAISNMLEMGIERIVIREWDNNGSEIYC